MIAVVVGRQRWKGTREFQGLLNEYFSPEEVNIAFIGKAYRMGKKNPVYFIPLPTNYETNVNYWEKRIVNGLGSPWIVVSLNPHIADGRKGIFIHTSGNPSPENVLGVNLPPKTLGKTNANAIGMIVRAVDRFSRELNVPFPLHLEATHDLPVNNSLPYLSFEWNGEYADLAVLALVAALGVEKTFIPYLTLGIQYYGDEFLELSRRGRRVSAYHVPLYLAHGLDDQLYMEAQEKGKVRGIIVGRGIDPDTIPVEARVVSLLELL